MTEMTTQAHQSEWLEQWKLLQDNELFLFQEWIAPYTLAAFKDKTVLEAGCGGGQHTHFMAPYAKHITAVDLNTIILAKERNQSFNHIDYVEADVATMDLQKQFDMVVCIGVLQHTDSPEKTIINLKKHLKPGGLLLVWCYSAEGNLLTRYLVEPWRKLMLKNYSRSNLLTLSKVITALMYIPIYTFYLLPLRFLPYYEYFQNFRKMSFYRNTLNVFDKLNAPQTDFISKARAEKYVQDLEKGSVLPYKGVSWRMSGYRHSNKFNTDLPA